MLRKILAAAIVAVSVLMLAAPADGTTTNTNDPVYWEDYLGDLGVTAYCYKHGNPSSNSHGSSYGPNVRLNPFQQSWPGDHWELLIVKGGSVDVGYGPGNAFYRHPSAGQNYTAPRNGGGNVPSVSHWIVCKGEHPTTTTTSTTTTQPRQTTTTTPPTTVPPTTTTQPEVTTTVPEVEVTVPQTPGRPAAPVPADPSFTG